MKLGYGIYLASVVIFFWAGAAGRIELGMGALAVGLLAEYIEDKRRGLR